MRTPRLLGGWALITASIAALLFLSAGTVRIVSIRNYLVTFSLLLLATMLAVDPSLAQERAKPTEPGTDDSRVTTGLLFLLTLAVASFSVGHHRQSFNVPPPIRHLALAAFLLSGAFQGWAMIVNPFFSPAVRIQTERGHHLILTGPYRWIGLMPAAGFVLLIKHRARLEDEFLKNNLPGYIAYARRVGGPYAR